MNPHRRLRSEHFHFRSEVADQLILDGIHLSEQALSLIHSSPSPSSFLSVPILRELKVPYISHSHNSSTPGHFLPKNSKPTPVSFPPPFSHSLEQRPTRTLCIFCHWQRSQVLQKLEVIKVKSVNLGCRECNVTLCRDCFSPFHNIPSIPDYHDTSNHQTYSHSWVLNAGKIQVCVQGMRWGGFVEILLEHVRPYSQKAHIHDHEHL